MTCRKHPDQERVIEHQRQELAMVKEQLRRTVAALDRYGRHERGCRFARSHGHSACTCLLHDRIREGGLKP